MPAGLIHSLRHCGGPIAMIAAALMALQVVVAGLLTAQAAAAQISSPFDPAICHGDGGAGAAGGTLPDGSTPTDAHWNDCCAICLAASPAPLLPQAAAVPAPAACSQSRLAEYHGAAVPIDRRAVRAGPSQAPPSVAAI